LAVAVSLTAQGRVDFVRDVRPILQGSCATCHGPDAKARMANLRLDTREGAAAVIAPGDPAKSKLYQRITSNDAATRMPMGGQLSEKQVATLRAWIEQGAPWETHWAFVAPVRPAVPRPGNPIDAFIRARLEKEGLHPSPPAEKTALIRRVTLDLTGLPPTPAEVDAFVADHSASAYEKVVDRLLASPHYGERMAMQWLDLARYADSHGYHIDSHRDMWPWRDWVISAFNRNLPYDQFTVWQIAGDLLPNATREQRVASGFNRNHMITFEGGAIPEEYEVEYVVDRVETTSVAFMGLTMGCARCHDHKYDPIKQKEFYQFFAFFNSVEEKGLDGRKGNADPVLRLSTPEQEGQLAQLDTAVKALDKQLAPEAIATAQTAWEKARLSSLPAAPRDGLAAHYEFDNNLSDSSGAYQTGRITSGDVNYTEGPVGRAVSFNGEGGLELVTGAPDPKSPFSVALWVRSSGLDEMPIVQRLGFALRFEQSWPLPYLRRAARVDIVLNGKAWRTRVPQLMAGQDGVSPWHHYVVSSDGASVKLFVDAKPVELEAVAGQHIVQNAGPFAIPPPFEGAIDDLRIYRRQLAPAEIAILAFDEPIRAILWSGPAAAKRSGMQKSLLREYFLTRDASEDLRALYTRRNATFAEWQRLERSIPTTMVMSEKPKPNDSFVLARGDYRNQTEKVTPGVPSFLPPLPGQERNRLTLARWLVDPANPLTARVAVNHFWQMDFGTGLVKTSEDFGTRGELPSHPELLDWLATEFIRTGWDVRAMQRLIVTSETYRQSSRATPALLKVLLEKDPENRLLARGPRYRLAAETIRDNALSAAGLINLKIGGPPVFPYQPPGLWEDLAIGDVYSAQFYQPSHGEDLYRRSLYTFWKRTSPAPEMAIFDAPDRQKCIARRSRTNTPLQALVLMNDPTYVEASRALAARVMSEAATTSARIALAFRLATARMPSASEARTLESLVRRQLAHYRESPQSAAELLEVGESKAGAGLNKIELAAWTTVAQVILNLDETISEE
jgi:cytochrome c553